MTKTPPIQAIMTPKLIPVLLLAALFVVVFIATTSETNLPAKT
jgi:hypothetical protein